MQQRRLQQVSLHDTVNCFIFVSTNFCQIAKKDDFVSMLIRHFRITRT